MSKAFVLLSGGLDSAVCLAWAKRDFDEVPEHVREGLTVHFVESYQDVSKLIFD